ncbi:unnamed protein product, partial [Anisakis simplex]|uniref:Uncharacterized protein n=1 Tax=Anisakis simplex TaxID=6269 RepID=A0A0M3JD00_ANISI
MCVFSVQSCSRVQCNHQIRATFEGPAMFSIIRSLWFIILIFLAYCCASGSAHTRFEHSSRAAESEPGHSKQLNREKFPPAVFLFPPDLSNAAEDSSGRYCPCRISTPELQPQATDWSAFNTPIMGSKSRLNRLLADQDAYQTFLLPVTLKKSRDREWEASPVTISSDHQVFPAKILLNQYVLLSKPTKPLSFPVSRYQDLMLPKLVASRVPILKLPRSSGVRVQSPRFNSSPRLFTSAPDIDYETDNEMPPPPPLFESNEAST